MKTIPLFLVLFTSFVVSGMFGLPVKAEDPYAERLRQITRLERQHNRALDRLELEEQAAINAAEAVFRDKSQALESRLQTEMMAHWQAVAQGQAEASLMMLGGATLTAEQRLLDVEHRYGTLAAIEQEFDRKRRALERELAFAVAKINASADLNPEREAKAAELHHQWQTEVDALEMEKLVKANELELQTERAVVNAEIRAQRYLLELVQKGSEEGRETDMFALMGDPRYQELNQEAQSLRNKLMTKLDALDLEFEQKRLEANYRLEDALDEL